MSKTLSIFEQKEIYVNSSLGVKIKILNIGWQNIITKHPELKKSFSELTETLKKSDKIYTSRIDPRVFLYYYKIKNKPSTIKVQGEKYFCAVCKHYNSQGFLITAYYTYKLKGKKYE